MTDPRQDPVTTPAAPDLGRDTARAGHDPTPSTAPSLDQLKGRTWAPVYRAEHLPQDELGPAWTWHWLAIPAPIHDLVRGALTLRYPAARVRLVAWTVDRQQPGMILASVRRRGQTVAVAVSYEVTFTPWLHLVDPAKRHLIKPTRAVTAIDEIATLTAQPTRAAMPDDENSTCEQEEDHGTKD